MKRQDEVITRLRRVKGQVEGLIKMQEEGRDCLEVVTQITAVREALGAVGRKILASEACRWTNKGDKLDKVLKELFKIQ